MTLLIATQDINAPAETYVRQHIRCLAPGATVGVGLQGDGPPPDLPLPFHQVAGRSSDLGPGPIGKLATVRALALHGFTGAPTGAPRAALRQFMQDHDVRIVLAEFGPTGAALRTLCRELDIPLVVNFHGFDATVMPRSRLVRHAYRRLAREARAIIGGSQHFRDRLIGLGFAAGDVHVVPCGIDLDSFSPGTERNGRRLIAIGRLTAKKAPHLLVQAVALARESVPDLVLDVIGDGPMRPACAAEIGRLGLGDAVTLHGACDHAKVRAMLARADIFVQHSIVAPNGDTESQGISLVEAMASCLPVVVTDHNGFSETVADGTTGFLVPERDVAAMARRLVTLLQDDALRESMGQAGRARARARFDVRVVTRQMRDILSRFADLPPDPTLLSGGDRSATQTGYPGNI